jgi:hypothetical protein
MTIFRTFGSVTPTNHLSQLTWQILTHMSHCIGHHFGPTVGYNDLLYATKKLGHTGLACDGFTRWVTWDLFWTRPKTDGTPLNRLGIGSQWSSNEGESIRPKSALTSIPNIIVVSKLCSMSSIWYRI